MRRWLLVVPVLALGAAGLSGCGGDEASAAQVVRTASAATVDAGSAQVTYEAEVAAPEGAEGPDSFAFTGEGAMDFETGDGELTFEYPDVAGLGTTTMESRFSGTEIYMRSPIFGPLPGGVEWIRMDIEALLDDQAGVDIDQLQSNANDPTNSLAMLDGASEDGVEDLGEEEVNGVTATHYRAVIDVSDVYDEADAVTDPEAFEAFMDQFEDDTLEVEAWIDDDGRVVRQRYEQPFPTAVGDASMTMTIEFTDFGTGVDVEIPDQSDTADITELLPDA